MITSSQSVEAWGEALGDTVLTPPLGRHHQGLGRSPARGNTRLATSIQPDTWTDPNRGHREAGFQSRSRRFGRADVYHFGETDFSGPF